LDVSAIEITGALTDPQHMTRRSVRIPGAGIDSHKRTFVIEQQGLVTHVKLCLVECSALDTARIHEAKGTIDLRGQRFIPLVGSVRNEPLIPGMHLPEICEAALRE